MAADPGTSSAPYHLFLTRIPPKLPKEEVEAALLAEFATRRVEVLSVTVVPQSAWKNKGFGFVVLNGSPNEVEIASVSAQLDNNIRVGGKALNVRVCQAPVAGGKPAVPSGPLNSWDQPSEKIARLCAQVLHCYFARRAHQEVYRAEKLLALLSATVAPSCSQEPRPLSLWGRDVYGSLEAMLLAIGIAHFGGSWSLTGTIAERSAILAVGKARHMQGWDALRDPLPIATLLRLAACKQRLEDIHTPEASSGFSTPTVCRRCSDCGSLSAMHSTEQPSCSQSEASWSLRSLYAAAAASATETTASSSEATSSLGTPSNGSEGTTLSSSTSVTPVSWGSCKSMERSTGAPETLDTERPAQCEARPPDARSASASNGGCTTGTGGRVGGACGGQSPGGTAQLRTAPPGARADVVAVGTCVRAERQQLGNAEASSSGRPPGRTPGGSEAATPAGSGSAPGSRNQQRSRAGAQAQAPRPGQPGSRHSSRTSMSHSPPSEPQQQQQHSQHPHHQPHHHQQQQMLPAFTSCGLRAAQFLPAATTAAPFAAPPASASAPPPPAPRPTAQPHKSVTSLMPTAQDLMGHCAAHLKLLFARNPGQDMISVPDLARLLSEAPDVVAWGSGAPYFSLEGYAHAVYGSFERFLLEISRLYFGGRWHLEGGHRTGELRVLCVAAGSMRSACSTPGNQGPSCGTRGSSMSGGAVVELAATPAAGLDAAGAKARRFGSRGSGGPKVASIPPRVPAVAGKVTPGR